MATFRASNILAAGTRTNSTLTKPTGTAAGDLLVMLFSIESDILPQPPTGWRFGYNIDHSAASVDQWIFWKRAGASEPANYTITHASTWTNGYIVAVQDVSQSVNPSFSSPAQGTGTTATANAVTSVGSNAWIGLFVNTFGDHGLITPPGGSTPTFTERYESTNNVYTADGTLASAGSTGTKAVTFSGSQQWMATLMVAEDVATTATAPFVVQPAYAALTTSASPSVTFNVPVVAGDVVVMWATSQATVAISSMPSGWVNVLGGTTVQNSDSHGMACAYHVVTAGEESAQTLTYTATSLFSTTHTGTVLAALVRNIDAAVLDSAASTFSNANTATPHVLAGLTGADLSDDSIVLSAVAKDATGAYSTLPSGWEFLVSFNTNQGSALFRREAVTVAGADVTATNVTPSAGDEYVSITVALLESTGGGTSATATPGVIGMVSALPAAIPAAGTVTAPAVISRSFTMPAATGQASKTTAPALTTATTTMPAVTTQAGSAPTPAVVAAPVTMPAATTTAGATLTPVVLAATTTMPAVSTGASGSTAPAVIVTAATLPAASPSVGSTLTPAAIARAFTLPAATTQAGGVRAPAVIAATVTTPAPILVAGSTATPAATVLALTIPAATATGGGSGTATPAALVATVTIPAVTKVAGTIVAPGVIAVPVTIPAVITQAGGARAPAVITALVTFPAAVAQAGGVRAPGVIPLIVAIPAATAVGTSASSATPAAIAATTLFPVVSPVAGALVTPAKITATVALPTPANAIHALATPAALVSFAQILTATVRGGGTATPAAIVATVIFPLAYIPPEVPPAIFLLAPHVISGIPALVITGTERGVIEGADDPILSGGVR